MLTSSHSNKLPFHTYNAQSPTAGFVSLFPGRSHVSQWYCHSAARPRSTSVSKISPQTKIVLLKGKIPVFSTRSGGAFHSKLFAYVPIEGVCPLTKEKRWRQPTVMGCVIMFVQFVTIEISFWLIGYGQRYRRPVMLRFPGFTRLVKLLWGEHFWFTPKLANRFKSLSI